MKIQKIALYQNNRIQSKINWYKKMLFYRIQSRIIKTINNIPKILKKFNMCKTNKTIQMDLISNLQPFH